MNTKITLKLEGLHCNSCALNIDLELEDKKGIKKVNTNYAKSQTEIEFNSTQISEEEIKKIINNLGYTII